MNEGRDLQIFRSLSSSIRVPKKGSKRDLVRVIEEGVL